jgi:hypothetical protein
MLNHERGTTTVTCEAPRANDGQVLREQFKHLHVVGCAISVGIHLPNSETTTAVMPCIFAVQVLRRVTAADDESAETG